MYVEIKMLLSGIGFFIIICVIPFLFGISFLLSLLMIVSLFLFVASDLLLCLKVTPFKPLFEPTPIGKECMEIQELDNNVSYYNTVKGAEGLRLFRLHGHNASVINNGKGICRLPGGNTMFRAFERYDGAIEPQMCKALENMDAESLKEFYYKMKKREESKLRQVVRNG